MVRSNSLPEGTLLHVKNDEVIEVETSMGSHQRTTASTMSIIPAMPSIQDQAASSSSSTLPIP
jgi:hypothetical protein